MSDNVKPIPDGYHTVTPYLIVNDADALISFVERAFGGETLLRHADEDGNVRHAEVRIGDSPVMLGQGNDEWPPRPAVLHLYVEEVDRVYRQALDAGARSLREPEDMFYGDRTSGVEDPTGNQWWITTHIEDVSPEEMARRERELAGGKEKGS